MFLVTWIFTNVSRLKEAAEDVGFCTYLSTILTGTRSFYFVYCCRFTRRTFKYVSAGKTKGGM